MEARLGPVRLAGDRLLDSYEEERRPVAEHNATRSADPNGSVRGIADELRADLGGRIPHAWLPGEVGTVSTLDLLGDGLTLFTGPGEGSWATRRGAPPVTVRRLDAMTARTLGIAAGAALLVRPDAVPAAIWTTRSGEGGIRTLDGPNRPITVFEPSPLRVRSQSATMP
jgi:putative polyketide hydroxylase